MSCADDLTTDDLNSASTLQVLERVSGGEGSNSNLWGEIDRDNVVGVNLLDTSTGSASKVIKTWDDRFDESQYVESGVDDELILHIPFTSSLRLRTLLLRLPHPTHPHRPSRLRIYINLPNCPDFNDVEGMPPIMDLDVSDPYLSSSVGATAGVGGVREVEEWGLKVQKMANVFSVTLLFSEATTNLRSKIFYVGFKGDSKHVKMDMSKLGSIPAASAPDQPVDQAAEKKGSGHTTIH